MSRRRATAGGDGHDGADERWLLTYADMITLLMCLFMVLWSISSVNISKLQILQKSLSNALSGKPTVSGGQSVLDGSPSRIQGVQPDQPMQQSIVEPVVPHELTHPVTGESARAAAAAGAREEHGLEAAQRRIEAYARAHGSAGRIETTIDQRGLVVRLLTDGLVFDSGQAVLKPAAAPLIRRVSDAIRTAVPENPIRVEGNTDNVPISGGVYPSNWELSAARAAAVVEALRADGVGDRRISAAFFADTNPVAPNTTAAGRAENRRVDVVVLRTQTAPQGVGQ